MADIPASFFEGLPYNGYYQRMEYLNNLFSQQRQQQEREQQQLALQRQQQKYDMESDIGERLLKHRAVPPINREIGFSDYYSNGMLQRRPVFGATYQPAGLADTTRRDQIGLQREELAERAREFDLTNELNRDRLQFGSPADWQIRSIGDDGLARVNRLTGYTDTLRSPTTEPPKLQFKNTSLGGAGVFNPSTGAFQTVLQPTQSPPMTDADKLAFDAMLRRIGELENQPYRTPQQNHTLSNLVTDAISIQNRLTSPTFQGATNAFSAPSTNSTRRPRIVGVR